MKKIENIILEILNNKDINIFSRNKAILILCDNNLTYDLDTCIKEDHDIFVLRVPFILVKTGEIISL